MSLYWISALCDDSAALAPCKTCSGRLQSAQLGGKGIQKTEKKKQMQQSELLYSASEEQRDGQKVALAHCVNQCLNKRNLKHSQWRSNKPQKGNLILNASKVEDKVTAQTSLLREAANSKLSELTNNRLLITVVITHLGYVFVEDQARRFVVPVPPKQLYWLQERGCFCVNCRGALEQTTPICCEHLSRATLTVHTHIHIHTYVHPRWLFVMNIE